MFDINREHPEYAEKRAMWRKYGDLYAGGEQLKARAEEYLTPRQKEPRDVYAERLSRVFYENYIGSIIDWYTATLFRREPALTYEGVNEQGKAFFAEFTDDCDLKGTTLTDFFRRVFVDALVRGKSHILADFPRWNGVAETRAEEDAAGASRAYLSNYPADELINWSYDERGNYEWVVLRTSGLRKQRIEDTEWCRETRWAYYDKQSYRIYEEVRPLKDVEMRIPFVAPQKTAATLTASGRHGMAKLNRVPLFDLALSDGLWLMNKAGLLQLEHLNKSNALGWALTMGLFAMPVVYSERDWDQMVGESYYIQLGPQDKFGWTEPEGKVFQIAADNLTRLQEEIYRVCYLAHAGGSVSSNHAVSAQSKQRDYSITQEVLRAYGDGVKETMKRVLRAVAAAREDGLEIAVSGMDEFDIGVFGTEVADAQQLLGMGIESPTLRKQIYKKLAFQYLCDARQEIKDEIGAEIDGK